MPRPSTGGTPTPCSAPVPVPTTTMGQGHWVSDVRSPAAQLRPSAAKTRGGSHTGGVHSKLVPRHTRHVSPWGVTWRKGCRVPLPTWVGRRGFGTGKPHGFGMALVEEWGHGTTSLYFPLLNGYIELNGVMKLFVLGVTMT